MSWGKAKCPECDKVFEKWNIEPASGEGSLGFDENGLAQLSVTLFTVNFTCPNCSWTLKDISNVELEEWFENHKVD